MTRYTVQVAGCASREIQVDAESPEEAAAKVHGMVPMIQVVLEPEFVDEGEAEDAGVWGVLGRCESCMGFILEGRDAGAGCDEDGVWVCRKCATVAEAEEHAS